MTDAELVDRIMSSRADGSIVRTTLTTDQRVLARVTDGIYRQPGSALRELISNAYDADAQHVVIVTDRPRFKTISVRDDGNGMSIDELAHMLQHIGGSAKGSEVGQGMGVSSSDDNQLSPKLLRRMIGHLGIGLFSVSQLTQGFQVATKREGDEWRSIAEVSLVAPSQNEDQSDTEETVRTGNVAIWQERAADVDSHGTTILLNQLRPSARKTLQSAPEWQRVANGEERIKPRYHVGHYSSENDEVVAYGNQLLRLPWREESSSESNMEALVAAVWEELDIGDRNPRLEQLFDHYLQMVWDLALAIPAPYVEGHPFQISLGSTVAFDLPGNQPGAAKSLDMSGSDSISQRLTLKPAGLEGSDEFEVRVDDILLKRPLRFRNIPSTSHAIKHPLLFVGECREAFEGIDLELSAGPLAFQAYFLWAPKIVPVEHNGVLIRVHGASGTLFDPSFLKFKLAEPTRLRQISCEIFVTEGLEYALNIDRESLSESHPHTVRLTRWLHTALVRVINQQKAMASRLHREARAARGAEHSNDLERIVEELWDEQSWDGEPAPAEWTIGEASAKPRLANAIRIPNAIRAGASSSSESARKADEKLLALARVMDAFSLLSELDASDQEILLRYCYRILRSSQ